MESINMYEVDGAVASGRLFRIDRFPSLHVESRTVDIWLPNDLYFTEEEISLEDYEKDQDRVSVIYMHDGQMLFDSTKTWNKQEWRADETLTSLINSGQIDQTVVVAVWNNGEKRWAEYTPKPAFQNTPNESLVEGKWEVDASEVVSDQYVKFLAEELVPYIDRVINTEAEPSSRTVMGSSKGGLISLYTHFERPDVFGKVGSISTHWPIISPDQFSGPVNNPLFQSFATYITGKLTQEPEVNRSIYFDYGDQTLDAFYPPYQAVVNQIMETNSTEKTQWATYYDEGAAHNEISWANRLDKVIMYLLASKSPVEQ